MDPSRTANLALGSWPARALTAAAELGVLDLPPMAEPARDAGVEAVDGGRTLVEAVGR